jgi:SecD/SecF fusion protein
LTTTLADKPGVDYREAVKDALESAGVPVGDVQVQQLSRANQLRIRMGMDIEQVGKPFYDMPERVEALGATYEYQHNPRIVWVVDALHKAGLDIQPTQLASLNLNWTVMSGQFSEAMRNNAVYGLGLALLAILIYITIRFEFKFAIAAVIGLTHDVLATVGFLALYHLLGLSVEIDLQVIGAIMLIVGYSLNDTIIVFDRLREDIRLLRKLSYPEIINHALNVTLNRTLMTSGTTMLVLLSLVLLGGKTIFGFALVMLTGVGIGTLSSLFIAPPVLLYFHNREERKGKEELELKRA